MSKNFNTDNNIKAMETINTANKEERTMSNNVNNATINTENKEESIMRNNVNEATVNTENKEERAMSNRNENKIKEETTMTNNQTNNEKVETVETSSQTNNEKRNINYAELERPKRLAKGQKNRCKENIVTDKKEDKKNNIKEDTTMANTGKNMEAIPAMEIPSLIPKDEQAVEEQVVEEQAVKESEITFYEIPDEPEDLIAEIPEDEREDVSELERTDFAVVKELGYFQPIHKMKGFMSDLGDKFYARVYVDSKHKKFIEYCQQFRNGDTSAILKIPCADLFLAASNNYQSKGISTASVRNAVNKFLLTASKDYFNVLDFPEEYIDIPSVLKTLVRNYSKLPWTSDIPRIDIPELLYGDTIQIIKKLGNKLVDEHDAYYTLDKEQMDMVARGMGVSRNKLLKKLEEFNFLYTTASSVGYQTCVRFRNNTGLTEEFLGKTHTEWCYCVLKMEFLAKQKKLKEQG